MKARCCVTLQRSMADIELAAHFSAVPPIDRDRRLRDCRKAAGAIARRYNGDEVVDKDIPTFRFHGLDDAKAKRIARQIEIRLTQILRMPLTSRMVDHALGISARERLRWYKDGRLPICGHGRVGQGNHVLRHPLFPIDAIAQILATPSLIESWRQADAKAVAPAPTETTE